MVYNTNLKIKPDTNIHNKSWNKSPSIFVVLCLTYFSSYLTISNNQSLPLKSGEAFSVIADAPGYPNACIRMGWHKVHIV